MKDPTPAQQAVYDRIASLKTPQCADNIANYFKISRCTAALHMRNLYNMGKLEVAMKVRSVVFYKKADPLRFDPAKKIEPLRRRSLNRVESFKQDETKVQRARSDSVILQDVWGKVVSR